LWVSKKAFDSVDREVLWFKMRILLSGNTVNIIKRIYDGIFFCNICEENEVTNLSLNKESEAGL
jgi:hypothetical protein